MYQFKIKKQEDGGYKFELGNIKILVDDYVIKDGIHYLRHPAKAFAYFTVEDSVYGLSNEPMNYETAEDFYDAIRQQYQVFSEAEAVPVPGSRLKYHGNGLNGLEHSL